MTQNRPQRGGDAELFGHISAPQRVFMPINETQMDVWKYSLAPPKAENGADSSAPNKAIC